MSEDSRACVTSILPADLKEENIMKKHQKGKNELWAIRSGNNVSLDPLLKAISYPEIEIPILLNLSELSL